MGSASLVVFIQVGPRFLGARKRVIDLVTQGKVTQRVRGPKKDEAMAAINEARDRSIETFKDQSTKAQTLQNAQPIDDWKKDNTGKCPRAMGETIEVHFHEKEWKECVMFNVLKGNMFRVIKEDAITVRKKEVQMLQNTTPARGPKQEQPPWGSAIPSNYSCVKVRASDPKQNILLHGMSRMRDVFP